MESTHGEEWPDLETSFANRRRRARDASNLMGINSQKEDEFDSDSSGAAGYGSSGDEGAMAERRAKRRRGSPAAGGGGRDEEEAEEEAEEDMFAEDKPTAAAAGNNSVQSSKEKNDEDKEDYEYNEDDGIQDGGLASEYITDGRRRKGGNNNQSQDEEDDDEDETTKPIAVTGFNMREELEGGRINDDGVYVETKDEGAIHDTWLQDVKQTKRSLQQVQDHKNKHVQRERTRQLQWETRDVTKYDRNQCYIEILRMLNQGESVPSALMRFSGGEPTKGKKGNNKKVNRKANNKGKRLSQQQQQQQQNTTKDVDAINRLTELSDRLTTDFGDMEVYSSSYESIVRRLRIEEVLPDNWRNGDPVPTDTDNPGESHKLF